MTQRKRWCYVFSGAEFARPFERPEGAVGKSKRHGLPRGNILLARVAMIAKLRLVLAGGTSVLLGGSIHAV